MSTGNRRLTDEELAARTRQLLFAAQNISRELALQTERLATTIEVFHREVVDPMRDLHGGDDDRPT